MRSLTHAQRWQVYKRAQVRKKVTPGLKWPVEKQTLFLRLLAAGNKVESLVDRIMAEAAAKRAAS